VSKLVATTKREQSVAAFDTSSPFVMTIGVLAGISQTNPAIFAIGLLTYEAMKHPRGWTGRPQADSFLNQMTDVALLMAGYALGNALKKHPTATETIVEMIR
jgi:hypothetical protein